MRFIYQHPLGFLHGHWGNRTSIMSVRKTRYDKIIDGERAIPKPNLVPLIL